MKRLTLSICFLALAGTAHAQNCQDLRDAGDTLTWAIPVAALGITALKKDRDGALQWGKTAVYTGATVGLFKAIGDKTRPDANTSRQSFVSGHSAGGFLGASYLYTRYGKGYGIPAYGLAILTAYSRVCAQKHFADDVLGGAMVAMMANWYATSPIEGSARLYPSFTSNGLELSFSGFFDGNRQPREPQNFEPRYAVTFEFGPVVQDKNLIRSPNDSGTIIDLEALEAEFHMTARMIVDMYLKGRHELRFWYGPMGMTDFASPAQPFELGNDTYDPNDGNGAIFDSNYRWWDVRGTWRYRLIDNDRWTVKAGLGVQYSRTQFNVEQRESVPGTINRAFEAEESVFAPVIHAAAAYHFNEKWSIEAEIDAAASQLEHYWNNALFVRYRPSLIWDLSLGGRFISSKLDRDQIYNEIELSDVTFQLTRSF